MSPSDNRTAEQAPETAAVEAATQSPPVEPTVSQRKKELLEARRWWIKLLIQPALLLACGALLLTGLGVAQQLGWISAGGSSSGGETTVGDASVTHICPMMCTPPQQGPGRCPVCAMELVPATSSNGNSDPNAVQIDTAARRVANIQTVAVQSMPVSQAITAIGELCYDEGTLKTLSAYVDGRIDRLFADFTGVVVNKGDHLALVYSPKLYSSQVEYLLAKKSRDDSQTTTLKRVFASNNDLYESARQRLIELGMTEMQIGHLEDEGEASSRMYLCAPISGTVIEKFATEGQYVKEGQPIYKLADLSTVWLMLELFPDDAAAIRYGQKVTAEVQSLPGRKFTGRVAFIDPNVDPKTRTVGVRVVIRNEDDLLRVGDYAKASIEIPVISNATENSGIFDPELANKWISPRHPHVVSTSEGQCPICGIGLVPAAQFGFTDKQDAEQAVLTVPRDAVLMAGSNSVVYVETETGRFEIRRVVLGPSVGANIVVLDGVKAGEMVATRGNFLIDSQMQLAGNPSLIDPTKAQPQQQIEDFSPKMLEAIAELPDDEQTLAKAQRICPVTKMMLGSMGAPAKVDIDGRPVFICCQGCETRLLKDPQTYLANLDAGDELDDEAKVIAEAFAKLTPADRALAQRQRICPVADYPLGSMGMPKKVDVNGTPVFICCEGCRESLLEAPDLYLAKLDKGETGDEPIEIPAIPDVPIGVPEVIQPQSGLPEIGVPEIIVEPVKDGDEPQDGANATVADVSKEVVR